MPAAGHRSAVIPRASSRRECRVDLLDGRGRSRRGVPRCCAGAARCRDRPAVRRSADAATRRSRRASARPARPARRRSGCRRRSLPRARRVARRRAPLPLEVRRRSPASSRKPRSAPGARARQPIELLRADDLVGDQHVGTPPSTSASASLTFWQQTPTAPRAIWREGDLGALWLFACGRSAHPRTAQASRRAPEVALEGIEVEEEGRRVDASSSRHPHPGGRRCRGDGHGPGTAS